MPKKEKFDIHAHVTEQIVAALEKGVRPWSKPWHGTASAFVMPKRHGGEFYTGINVVLLWSAADEKGYSASTWMTFKQAVEYGGKVRKGERGTMIVYMSKFTKKVHNDESGEDETQERFVMRYYNVFNVEQIDDLPERFYPAKEIAPDERAKLWTRRIKACETFTKGTKAKIAHGGGRACYSPTLDEIKMPEYEDFKSREGYYSTLFHELTHWTGHDSRLKRDLTKGGGFGTPDYAFEELIAELGGAMLCSILGVVSEPDENNAAYVASWLKALKNDKKLIFKAATKAQKAVEFMHELQPQPKTRKKAKAA